MVVEPGNLSVATDAAQASAPFRNFRRPLPAKRSGQARAKVAGGPYTLPGRSSYSLPPRTRASARRPSGPGCHFCCLVCHDFAPVLRDPLQIESTIDRTTEDPYRCRLDARCQVHGRFEARAERPQNRKRRRSLHSLRAAGRRPALGPRSAYTICAPINFDFFMRTSCLLQARAIIQLPRQYRHRRPRPEVSP